MTPDQDPHDCPGCCHCKGLSEPWYADLLWWSGRIASGFFATLLGAFLGLYASLDAFRIVMEKMNGQ